MDFSKVILMTDLDGTLLTDSKEILPEDMSAIRRFRAEGGIFTMATGRGYSMAKPVAQRLELDVPAVIFNGAAVYDFNKDKFLWHSEIGAHARDYVNMLIERFSDIAIEVLCEEKVYVPSINEIERKHLALERVQPVRCAVSEIPDGGWLKVLIAYPPEQMQQVIDFVEANCKEKAHWVRSEAHYFEMLPVGVNKGSGFEQLLRILGKEQLFTVGVGDYNNDLELIKQAKLGAAVGSAQEAVKEAADIVLCDNNSGAMAELISYIERL